MRRKRQVDMIKLVNIEIHRKDDDCLREPMQFNCEVGAHSGGYPARSDNDFRSLPAVLKQLEAYQCS